MAFFFVPDRKSFYYRSHIPKRLRRLIRGRHEIWRSLDTTDRDEARLRAARWGSRTLQLYRRLKRVGERMTEEQREALVTKWLDSQLEEAEDWRVTNGPYPEDQGEGASMILTDQVDDALEQLATYDFSKIEKEAVELLQTAGVGTVDRESADFKKLCRRLLQAKLDYLVIEQQRWNGDYQSAEQQQHQRQHERWAAVRLNGTQPVTPSVVAPPAMAAVPTPTPTGPPFSEVVERYLRENPRTPRTTRQLKSEVQRFLAVIGGDRVVSTITKADCITYKDALLTPTDGRKAMHLNTVSNRITTLASIFKWCEAQGYIPENTNPARGLQPSAKAVRKATQETKMFTDEQLVTIFGSAKFKVLRQKHPHHYWVTLLCLFLACRPEEAAQLRSEDVDTEDGIPYLRLSDADGMAEKTKDARRRVPVHESLIQLGFMAYVEHVRKKGHAQLFYRPTTGRNTKADASGKIFTRIFRGLGFTDPALKRYSLRHGGITKLEEAGCSPDMSRMLTGHAGQDIHSKVYIKRGNIKLSVLRDGLNRLRYDDVVKAMSMEGKEQIQ